MKGFDPWHWTSQPFWRPKLKGWLGRWFHHVAGKLMTGVGIGKVVDVGQVEGKRVPLLRRLFRSKATAEGKAYVKAQLLRYAAEELAENEAALLDGGFKLAKQTLGMGRQFVFAPSTCHRLPELALLAGNVLTILAATLPPIPSGYWDRRPQKTPGRLRRTLQQQGFPYSFDFDARIRKKASPTAHLPKGVAAHRRQKAAQAAPT